MMPTVPELREEAQQIITIEAILPMLAIATAALASANQGTPMPNGLTRDELIAYAGNLLRQPRSDLIAIFVNQLIQYFNGGSSGGSNTNIFSGIGDPNGVVTASGPALYFDATDPSAPVWYSKNTAGSSNNEWIG